MAGTITPAVCGTRGCSRWWGLIAIYTTFQVAGAALVGFLVAHAGHVLRAVYPWDTRFVIAVVGVSAVCGAFHDMQLLRFPLPSSQWQVPQSWKRFPRGVTVALYGLGIGLGVVTRIPFAPFYVVLVACAGMGSVQIGVGLLAVYAAFRAATTAITAHVQSKHSRFNETLSNVARMSPLVGYLNGIVLAGCAGLLLALFISGASDGPF